MARELVPYFEGKAIEGFLLGLVVNLRAIRAFSASLIEPLNPSSPHQGANQYLTFRLSCVHADGG